MPDLDDLRAPEWDLPTATEIRRRGDRHTRRRRLRSTVVGLGLGVALVVPVAAFVDDARPGGTEEGDAVASWLPTVPAGFELGRGLTNETAAPVVSSPDPGLLTQVPVCGRSHWLNGAPQRATDVLRATNGTSASARDERLLLVYPDDTTAREALRDVRRWAGSCPESAGSDGLGGIDLGEDAESWGYAVPGDADADEGPGPESLLVVRVGNALLLDRSATGGGTSAEGTIGRLQVRAADVVEQMCVFAEDPC
jgi:hypothetical protein